MANDSGTSGQKLYEIIRDQLIDDITSGVYPTGALLPSVREITVRWTVSTTTARKVLSELVSAGYARAEGTRGHISTVPQSSSPGPAKVGATDIARRDRAPSSSQQESRDSEEVRFDTLPLGGLSLGRDGDPHPRSPRVGLGPLRDFEIIIWQLTSLPWRARAAAIRAAREEESKIAAERDSGRRHQR